MKKKIYRLSVLASLMGILLIGLLSCEDMLDSKPEVILEPGQVYQTPADADAAVIGVYGKFLALAERYVVLNELRADLMDVTTNADPYLQQLSNHTADGNNPWADPRPFYEVILYCNDVLKNFDLMKAAHRLTDVEYNERYSDIGTLRSWLYLQVAIHWGTVPYITDPIQKVEDLKNVSQYPKLSLPEMIKTLTSYMESLPSKEMYGATSTLYNISRPSSLPSGSAWNTRTFFVNKKFFLADLYLWNGDYLKAATRYKEVMLTAVPGVDAFDSYKVKFADVSTNNDLSVGYVRYKEQDYNSLIDNNTQGWRSMFVRANDALFHSEWIWVLPFESNNGQSSPFVNLFSNTGGKYLVMPSQAAIDLWNAQVQNNGFTFDQRGRFTYRLEGGQPVIKKYIYDYGLMENPSQHTGRWFLGRAALLHLRFAEAANRDDAGDGKLTKVAWALLNPGGFSGAYDNPATVTDTDDMTNERQTFMPPPYDFGARNANTPIYYRDVWHRHNGIRGRAYVTARVRNPLYFDPAGEVVLNADGLKRDVEDKLIEEAALELAYEGNRWGDILRVAMRRNESSFLSDKIYDKLQKAGRTGDAANAKAKLDGGNWFLPFNWE